MSYKYINDFRKEFRREFKPYPWIGVFTLFVGVACIVYFAAIFIWFFVATWPIGPISLGILVFIVAYTYRWITAYDPPEDVNDHYWDKDDL
jgi:hypothetical protein